MKEKIELTLAPATHKWDIIQTEDGLYGYIDSSLSEDNEIEDIRKLKYLPIYKTGEIYANLIVYPKNSKSYIQRLHTKCRFLMELPEERKQIEYLKGVIESTIQSYDFLHRHCLNFHNALDEDGDPIEGTISKYAEEKLLKNLEMRKFYALKWLEKIEKPQAKKKTMGKKNAKKK